MRTTLLDMAFVQLVLRASDRVFTLEIPEFALVTGDKVALLGANGTGKSTFIEVLTLARAPSAAARFILQDPSETDPKRSSHDVAHLWREGKDGHLTRLRSRMIGYVPQSGGLFPFLTVRENLTLSLRLSSHWGGPDPIAAIADELGLSSFLDARPAALSVGQRQRAVIGRALVHTPCLLLTDEPTASLDRAISLQVLDLLCEAAARRGTAVVIATHDADLAMEFGFKPVVAQTSPIPDGMLSRFARPRPPVADPCEE